MLRRNTKQRQLVLEAVSNRNDHPTAEQIYNDVHKRDSSVSKGTVYRNLSILEQENQIKCLDLEDAGHYDWITKNHNHFICSKCGKLFDIGIEYDSGPDNKETSDGFIIQSHETIFRGLCPECNKKR